MNKDREFRKILAASFVSQTGSHFLTLAIAAFVFYTSGSPVRSALVFVVSFLPSIAVSARLGHWVDTQISARLIARNEVLSIIATLIAGGCIALEMPLSVLCVVLGLRSLLMFVSRSAATKWLKVITPPELQTSRIKLFYLTFFLSTAISGILAGIVLSRASIWSVVVLDIMSYLAGIGIMLSLKTLPVQSAAAEAVLVGGKEPSLIETLAMIFKMPVVRTSFLVVCLSQAIFQGSYSVLVSYVPIQAFKMGIGGVGQFQLAASFGITGGFLLNWFASRALVEKRATMPLKAMLVSLVAYIALMASVTTIGVPVSLAAFMALNFAYECVWLHHSSDFFRASPKASAARYQFTLSACAAFLMAVSTLAYSGMVQYFGVATASIAILFSGVVLTGISVWVGRRCEELPHLERAPA